MQAIQTKYLPSTNTKCSRIKAWCNAGSVTISYPHELSGQAVHRAAAEALLIKLDWLDMGTMLGGGLPGNGGCCFVFDNSTSRE
jgi:hypothetical protein